MSEPNAAIGILTQIQRSLKVPKSERNEFGRYNYRNIEGILEEAKKAAAPFDASIIMEDEVVEVGDRFYVKAVCSLVAPDGTAVSSTGWAREAESRKGMDPGQVTGACSSYARKYAAQGLFAISGEADLDGLPPAPEYPAGKFTAKCRRCGDVHQNFTADTALTWPCPRCGEIDWEAVR